MTLSVSRYHGLILVSIGSLCAFLSLVYAALWFLAPVGLGLFFYALLYDTKNSWHACGFGLLFGLVVSAAGVWWFWDTIPLNWLNLSPVTGWWAVFITWALVVTWTAPATALFAVVVRNIHKRIPPETIPILIPLLWLLQEQGRMWGFALLTLAPQSLFGAHFSATSLAYALAENHYVLQLAAFGGIANLEFALGVIGMCIALLVRSLSIHRYPFSLYIAFTLLFFLMLLPLGAAKVPAGGKPMTFALITADTSINDTTDKTNLYAQILDDMGHKGEHPDVIVYPEGNGLDESLRDQTARKAALQKLFGTTELLVVSSNSIHQGALQHETLFYESSTRGTLGSYNKIFLMPQGEYTPLLVGAIYGILQSDEVTKYLKNISNIIVRGNTLSAVPYKGTTLAGLLCSESLSPQLYHSLATTYHARVLLNLSNATWFRDSRVLYEREKQFAKVHAVQDRVFFLQASNGAPSFAVDPSGTLVSQSPWHFTGAWNVIINPAESSPL